MKFLIIILIIFVAVLFGDNSPVSAAQGDCYGALETDRETDVTTQSRFAQQFQSVLPVTLVSVSLNIYTHTSAEGWFKFQIQETTAGLPNGTTVTATVNIDATTVPERAVGVEQAFICGSIPEIQKFTFASPVTLNGGQMYAFVLYGTIDAGRRSNGWLKNQPDLVPLQGLTCVGSGCITNTGWQLSTFNGDNFDMWYSLETAFVDPADITDITIDDHINNLRKFLKLSGENGGLIFSMGFLGILVLIGIRFGIPFPIVAIMAAMLAGILSMAGIMPGWILMAVVTVAGLGLVLKLTSGKGGEDEP